MGPMKYLSRTGRIELVNKDQSWYAHNSKEIIQRVKHMRGDISLPRNILELTLDLDSCPSDYITATTCPDMPSIGAFEISTRGIKMKNGYVLHSTLVSKRKVVDYDEKLDSFDHLESDICDLNKIFQKIILGCNISYNESMAGQNVHRVQLNNFLCDLEKRHPSIITVNPNRIINHTLPASDIEDCNHFLPHFIERVSWLYLDAINRS